MECVIETKNLVKRYGKVKAVDGLSMRVEKGSIHALVGPNGSGKTTLIRMLMGTAIPTSGSFSLFNFSGEKDVARQRKRIGTLIEMPQFYNDRSAEETLDIIRRIRGIENKECILDALSIVGLLGMEKRRVGKFSLGMRQRLGIAKALLGNPELLILDEPINGMDPQGVSEMRALLFSLKEQGHTILLASHILKELTAVSTHYSMIRDGRLYDDFSAGELSKRCGEWLEIVTPDADRAEGLLRGMGENITVEGETVQIFGAVDSGEIIRKLVLGDCVVRGVGVKTNDLESYFTKMMGEKI